MIVLLPLAALIGSAITFVLLWPYGLAVAVVGLPFGGSLFALLLAVGCALQIWEMSVEGPNSRRRSISSLDAPSSGWL